MRWPGALALCAIGAAVSAACGGSDPPAQLSLVLDIPNGPLDPQGFTSVDVVLHEASGHDVALSADLADMKFALGKIAPATGVAIEATLRSDSGAAVGYGRATVPALEDGGEVSVAIRRPIIYLAGVSSTELQAGELWQERPATFSDLSIGTALDGTTTLASPAVLMISAGPSLYQVEQDTSTTTDALLGAAHVAKISTADHKVDAARTGDIPGEVLDGAGSDDDTVLAIASATQLTAFDLGSPGGPRVLATGRFDKVAIVSDAAGGPVAVAIKRGPTATACTTSELWWAPLAAGAEAPHMVAKGGFGDVASDRGHAYYVDACTGELGELTATGTVKNRTIVGTPTALAVSNGQAYVGLESQPATLSLVVASFASAEPVRLLWTETELQIVRPAMPPTVQRELEAGTVHIRHLEIGAGGDYVALSTTAQFDGDAISEVRFPEMHIKGEELRVFDAATGGNVQRYRSTCDGSVFSIQSDLHDWSCATIAGQDDATVDHDHHIRSMTFQFGKK